MCRPGATCRPASSENATTILFHSGDVRAFRVRVEGDQISIDVQDEDDDRPLIQAVLDQKERDALVRALLGPELPAVPTSVGDVARRMSAVPPGSVRTPGTA